MHIFAESKYNIEYLFVYFIYIFLENSNLDLSSVLVNHPNHPRGINLFAVHYYWCLQLGLENLSEPDVF